MYSYFNEDSAAIMKQTKTNKKNDFFKNDSQTERMIIRMTDRPTDKKNNEMTNKTNVYGDIEWQICRTTYITIDRQKYSTTNKQTKHQTGS